MTYVTSYCDLGVLSLRDLLESISLPEANYNDSNRIFPWVRIVLDINIFSMGNFVLSVNEWIDLGCFIVSFDSTSDDMGGPCVDLTVEWIMIDSEIFVKNLNDFPPLYWTPEMKTLMHPLENIFSWFYYVSLRCLLFHSPNQTITVHLWWCVSHFNIHVSVSLLNFWVDNIQLVSLWWNLLIN